MVNYGPNAFSGFPFLLLLLGFYLFFRPATIKIKPISLPKSRSIIKYAGIFLFFSLVTFIFQFWHFRDFGLYENDLHIISPVLVLDWHQLRAHIAQTLFFSFTPETTGNLLTSLAGFIGYRLGGIAWIYLFSMIIPISTSFMFFLIFKKLFGQELPAFFGALLFLFFPAYRTPQILYLTFSKQIGLLLMLASLWMYLHKRTLVFEICLFLSIIIAWEFTPIFFFFPLFQVNLSENKPAFLQNWLRYLVRISVPILLINAALSLMSFTTFKNSSLHFFFIPLRFYKAFTTGALNNGFRNFTLSPITVMSHFSIEILIVFIIGWITFTILFILTKPKDKTQVSHFKIRNSLLELDCEVSAGSNFSNTTIIGLISIPVLIYAFSGFPEHIPLNTFACSSSYTYLVSALPMILLFTTAFSISLILSKRPLVKVVMIILAACFLSLLGTDRLFLQKRLVQVWRFQQWLWTNVLAETQTLSDDTLLIIQTNFNNDLNFSNNGNFEININQNILPYLLHQHPDWRQFPHVIITSTSHIEPPEDASNLERIVHFYILDANLFMKDNLLNEQGERSPQIPFTELQKQPLFQDVYVNVFARKSWLDIINSGLENGRK